MTLSIITINYNNASGLQKTMESVLNQTSKDFEYIVVDGMTSPPTPDLTSNPSPEGEGSKKGAMGDHDVIENYVEEKYNKVDGFTYCKWKSTNKSITGGYYSEPDSGIYNAMNKGIRMAKGDYIHFLNSGDWLVDEQVVEKMLEEVQSLEFKVQSSKSGELSRQSASFSPVERGKEGPGVRCDILVGNVMQIRADGKIRKTLMPTMPVSLYTFYRGTIQHTSAYIRRALFDQYGLYDENLKIVSDWKWYMQVAGLNTARVQFTDMYVTCFDTTGISSTQLDLDKAERRKVLEELIPATILADYDRYHFDIDQMERIKKHPWLYRLFWFAERIYFKLDKWNARYWGWKKI